MKVSAQKNYAVLTGDVVDSSKLSVARRKALPALLERASRATRRAFPKAIPLEADIFRGDSWQLLVTEVPRAVRIALFFRACLGAETARGRGLATRIAVGVGTVDFVPGASVTQGDGEAYRRSGAGLDTLRRREHLRLVLPTTQPGLVVVVRLLDALAQTWTGPQARAVQGALTGLSQEQIARTVAGKVSQPVITRHLEKAGADAVVDGLDYLEQVLSEGG